VTIPQLAFINREEEAFLIAFNCLHNATKAVSGKFVLVTSGQMYGSGKTEMGKNATKALKENVLRVSRLARVYTEDSVKNYINSEYVLVDFSYLVPPSELLPTFSLALAYLTYCSFAKFLQNSMHESTQKEFLDLQLFTIRDVLMHCSKVYNKHFFIHWDEVSFSILYANIIRLVALRIMFTMLSQMYPGVLFPTKRMNMTLKLDLFDTTTFGRL
jgi:hypothetical protein